MLRPLRWYERLAIRFLARSPRIDQILIVQMPGETAAERQHNLTRLQQQQVIGQLEHLYQGPAADR